MDALTFQDFFRIGEVEILSKQGLITREVIEREVTDANAFTASFAAMADAVMGQLSVVEAAQFIDSASGDALDRLVWDRYRLTRKAASPAYGVVSFRTATPSPLTFTIPAGTVLSTQNNIKFNTLYDVVFSAGSYGPVDVQVRSQIAGSSQQALPDAITSILSNILNAPGNLTVNNDQATAGGNDRESDDQLRTRAHAFYSTVRRGTLAAIQQAGYSAPGVRSATAIELVDSNGYPGRLVELIVTDDYTDALATLNVSSASYAVQSQAFAASVLNSLADWRPAGTYVRVIVAQVIMLPIQIVLAYQAGFDQLAVEQAARAAVVQYTNSLRPGQVWVRALAQERLKQIVGLAYTGNELIVPDGNVTPTTLQVIRSTMSLVTPFGSGD